MIAAGGLNEGAFRGFSRAPADISYFELSGGLANVLDNLTFAVGPQVVPEPGTLSLIGLAFAALVATRRRRRD